MARALTHMRRTWMVSAICALALGLGPAACTAFAQDGDVPATQAPTQAATPPAAPADDPAPTPATAAAPAQTPPAPQQAAAAVAQAVQQAPVNVAIVVSVASPGDHGAVTQTNLATAGADAANVAQSAVPATGPAATADQTATAISQATQIAPANVYIPVSILSPGAHGPVTQVNVATAQATATNLLATAGQSTAPAGPADQAAGAVAGAAQQAPGNFAAPVTVGGVDAGDHPASQPWIWSWVWEYDCGSGAPPSVAAIGPIVAQLTGGAWDWDWTWTCSPGGSGETPAPTADAGSGTEPGTSQTVASGVQPGGANDSRFAGAQVPSQGDVGGAAFVRPPVARRRPSPSSGGRRMHARHGAGHGIGGLAFAATGASAGGGPMATIGITAISGTPLAATPPRPVTRGDGPAPPPRAPERPPASPPGPAPTLFAAGGSGGSGPGPLSVGFAALIGAFCLSVPRFGTRAQTLLVHRSPQAVPGRKRRPG